MKKILIITFEYPPTVGGIATYIHDLANALDTSKIIVLAPKHENSKVWDEQQKYKVIRKNMLFPKIIWPRWIRLCWQTWRLVRKEKIELIMIHHALPVGYIGVLQKKFYKIPFLLFSHGTDLVAGAASAWKRKMLAKVSERAAQIIFNSESLKSRFLRVFPQFEDKSLVVYPCPEIDFLEQPPDESIHKLRSQYALEGKITLLSVGRLSDGKGFPHLARLLPEILKQVPHLVWLIVGDGPKKSYLIEQIQKRDLQNVVRFIGEVPHDKLKIYYYLADVFAVLTHPDEGREEGLGLVFLEAAAAGLPIVAGRSGGVEESVLHTQTGIVVDIYKGDKAVVEALVEMLTNKEYAKRLGKQAKERIQSDFQWPHQVKKLQPWID
ncbi:MAG: glycosyltransferase family 4 protein [Patescibacteria group bacterium]